MVLVLKHADIVDLLTIDEVRDAVRAGLVEQGQNLVQLPARTTIDASSGQGWLRVMPAILNGSGIMGYKAMHSTPGVGVRYLVMLYDLATGDLLAQLDADWLTAQRTAATAAIATDALARKAIHQVGILGSSAQAKAALAAIARVRKLPRAKVYSPNAEHCRHFAREMSESLDISILPVGSAAAALAECDLVISVFRAGHVPLVEAEWIAPGAHVSAGSSVRPEARELCDALWSRAALVALDDRGHVFESGDGRSVLAGGAIAPEDTVELWELVSGKHPGRQCDADITLFKSVGTALQDLALAAALYRRARARGLGLEIGEFPRVR